MRTFHRALAALLCFAAGCAFDPPGQCSNDSNCGPGMACSSGICVAAPGTGAAGDGGVIAAADAGTGATDAGTGAADGGIAGADAGTATDAGTDPLAGLGTPPDPSTIGSLTGCPAPNVIYTEGDFGSSHPFPFAVDLSRGGSWSAFAQCANLDCAHTPTPALVTIQWDGSNSENHQLSISAQPGIDAGVPYPIAPMRQLSSSGSVVFASYDSVNTGCNQEGWMVVDSVATSPLSAAGSQAQVGELRARWQVHCPGSSAFKRGCVWYQGGVQPAPSDAGVFDVSAIPTDGGVLGAPGDCAADNTLHLDGDPHSVEPGVVSLDASSGTASFFIPQTGPSSSLQLGWGPAGFAGQTLFVSLDGGVPLQEGTIYQAAAGGNVMRIFDIPPPFPVTGEGLFQFQKLRQDATGKYVEVQATFVEHMTGSQGDVLRGCVHVTRPEPTVASAPDAGIAWARVISDDFGDARIDSMAAMPGGGMVAFGSTGPNVDLGAGPIQLDGGTATPFLMQIDSGGTVASVRPVSGGMSNMQLGPVATDSSGDVVLGGWFSAPTTLDPAAAPVTGTTFARVGGPGQTSWTRNFTTWAPFHLPALSIGQDGDVGAVVTIFDAQSVDFGCGPMAVPKNGGAISRMAGADGHCLWSGLLPANLTPFASRLAGDGTMTLVAAGNGPAQVLDCPTPLGPNGPYLLLLQLDGAGHCSWAKALLPGSFASGAAIDVSSDGDLIVASSTRLDAGTGADLGCGPMRTTYADSTSWSLVTARLAPSDGHCVWSELVDQPGLGGGTSIGGVLLAPDGQGGALIVPGTRQGPPSAAVLVHYAADGTRLPTPELFDGPVWNGLAAGPAGTWYLGGWLEGVFPVGGVYLPSGDGATHASPALLSVSAP